MNKQPFLIFFLNFIFGILLQDGWQWPVQISSWISLGLLSLIFLVFIRSFWVYKFRSIIYSISFIGFGMLLHRKNAEIPPLPNLQTKENLIFTVEKKLNSNQKNRRYLVLFSTHQGEYRAGLALSKELPELDFKQVYKGDLFMKRIRPPAYDFQFNYAKMMAREQVYYQAYPAGKLERAEKKKISILTIIRQYRFQLLQKIEKTDIQLSSKNFLKGIILADRTEMDEVTVADFQKSGLAHFIAISGTHVMIIFWLLSIIIRPFFSGKRRFIGIFISLVLIWLFAVFIGLGNSVVRSCLMISVYYIYVFLQRKTDLLHALSFSGLLILLLNTQQLFNVGFQLSFIAVFGIYWLYQPFRKLLPRHRNKFQQIMFDTLAISLAAQVVTMPLVLYYFHQFSWISIVANLVIVPLAEIVISASFIFTILIALGLSFPGFEWMYTLISNPLLQLIHWFAERDALMNKLLPMTLGEVVFLMLMIYFLRSWVVEKRLRDGVRMLGLFLLFLIFRFTLTKIEHQKIENLVVTHYKEETQIRKVGDRATFYISKETDQEKYRKYVVEPYLISRRIKKYNLIFKEIEEKTLGFEMKEQDYKNP